MWHPVARHIHSGQASTGDNRIWQSRHYVFWRQSITSEEKLYRAISSSDGTKIADLELIYHDLHERIKKHVREARNLLKAIWMGI